MIRIGTAAWSLPTEWQERFPEGDTHLHRYARVFDGVEINRTFKKMPRASTFARWAGSVPDDFRFSVKLTRRVTHDARLEAAGDALADFLEPVSRLEDRLGPLLVQLPPSLAFDEELARGFLATLRDLRDGPDALEARHESWFRPEASELLAEHRVARVAADPPRAEADGTPAGWEGLAYFRLHGTPRTYYSAYRDDDLEAWAGKVEAAADAADEVWCVFDNTAAGEGTGDALAMKETLESG